METDERMQSTLWTEFKDCTLLTIAHRLNTVIIYDKILVLDKGHVVEFDRPANLLKDPNSMLSSLVDDLGPNMAARMRDIVSGNITTVTDNLNTLEKSKSMKDQQRYNKIENVQRSFLEIRNAIVNNGAVDWREELRLKNISKDDWRSQMYGMSEKLYNLARTHLYRTDEVQPYEQDYK